MMPQKREVSVTCDMATHVTHRTALRNPTHHFFPLSLPTTESSIRGRQHPGQIRVIVEAYGEGLKPTVWRQCGRGDVPSVCGSKPRQVEQQEKQSMLGRWAGCSTVASSGEPTRARSWVPLSSEVPLLKGQQQPVLLLAEFCLLPQKPPHPFPIV